MTVHFTIGQMKGYIFKDIKDTLKEMHGVGVVFIQGGMFFDAIEEDAEFVHGEIGWRTHDKGGQSPFLTCSCPASYSMEDFLVRKLRKLGVNFAILRQVDYAENKVTREVVAATDKNLIGMTF